ncbi:hypothetical protein [Amycolatopsis benzoatilytica]|uniref:hypothetical protein n=1 Tax=Amycolatopsis benzoatilytica TaxID=346045 RepID=UPI0003786AAA|nr:hypothetical protein [Amycolatopsis benzoatilytica]
MEKEASRSRQVGGPVVTTLLWLIFIASAATNSVGGFIGMDYSFRMIAGGIAVAFLVILIVRFVARTKD